MASMLAIYGAALIKDGRRRMRSSAPYASIRNMRGVHSRATRGHWGSWDELQMANHPAAAVHVHVWRDCGHLALRQREPRYENKALRDLCKGVPCHLNFPGCTGGTSPDNPSVPCHSNWQSDGRGYAHKSHDFATVPGCPQCHHQLDYGPYTREQREDSFRLAQRRWWAYLWMNNLIGVKR